MNGGMSGDSFQFFGNIQKFFCFRFRIVRSFQIRALRECAFQCHCMSLPSWRDHFGNSIRPCIWHSKRAAGVSDRSSSLHGSKSYYLCNFFTSVFFSNICKYLISSCVCEIKINIWSTWPIRI